MIASELMTPDPVAVGLTTSVAEVWDLMRDMNIRHVPIVDRGALVGMVSDRDLRLDVGAILSVDGADALREQLGTPVVRVMSPDVISVDTETDLDDVIGLLNEQKVGALPVVRLGTREMVGILSYIDVLKICQAALAEPE